MKLERDFVSILSFPEASEQVLILVGQLGFHSGPDDAPNKGETGRSFGLRYLLGDCVSSDYLVIFIFFSALQLPLGSTAERLLHSPKCRPRPVINLENILSV